METLTDRVRERLKAMAENRDFSQHALARRLSMSQSNVSKTIHLDRPLTLEFLEAVSELTQLPVGELVSSPNEWKQVSGDEAIILRALRLWPKAVVRHLCHFLSFFADEAPGDVQTRNVHEHWRRLKSGDRDAAYALLVLLAEGMLPPTLREELTNRVITERYGRTTKTAAPTR